MSPKSTAIFAGVATLMVLAFASALAFWLMPETGPNPLGTSSYSLAQNPWYQAGKAHVEARKELTINTKKAKNVILFVGDGMGVSTITAARIFDGQSRGETGEENILSFEHFPNVALSKTYNIDAQTSDSAGTITAMLSGVKARIQTINISADHPGRACKGSRAHHVPTLFEMAEAAGLRTGIVTTTRLTHATPAGAYAHSPNRNWEDDSDLSVDAVDAGCQDIASQLLDFPYGDGIDVAMGGGRRHFLPFDQADIEYPNKKGRRLDGRNLPAEWRNRRLNSSYVTSFDELSELDLTKIDALLGLFEPSHMQYELDRPTDTAGEPSITEMTLAALDILERGEDGYVLLVEGGRIDHAHHAGNAARALIDVQAFNAAIAATMQRIDTQDTLVIVTADHSHTMTISGYAERGNPILGIAGFSDPETGEFKISTGADGHPYPTLSYANGPGAHKSPPRRTLTMSMARAPGYFQPATVPLGSETHGGEDVAVYAAGPWAHLIGGVMEQNAIFHVMDHALGLSRALRE